MRTQTVIQTIYKFSELSEKAQEKVLNKFADWVMQDCEFHASYVCQDAIEIGKLFGLEIKEKSFAWDLGWSSRSYLSFNGKYSYVAGCLKAVKQHAPVDHELHAIIERLVFLQKQHSYQLIANISDCNHEEDLSVSVDRSDCKHVSAYQESVLSEILEDYAHWILKNLKKEFEYQTSKEAIMENIEANGHEFLEDGTLA